MTMFFIRVFVFAILLLGAHEATHAAYDMPIGTPNPGFGLDDLAPEAPADWLAPVPGYYYVNFTTGSDSGNDFGTPLNPRRTIPRPIPPGSYVELEGNYAHIIGGVIGIESRGTSAPWVANSSGPVWVVATKTGTEAVFITAKVVVWGTNIYLEGFKIRDGGRLQVGSAAAGFPADKVVIRGNDVEGLFSDGNGSLFNVAGNSLTDSAKNVVIYDNVFHDTGDINSPLDIDAGLVSTFGHTSNIWFLSNVGFNASGSALQINPSPPRDAAHHIFAGKNEFYNVRQSGLWVKFATDVVFSENYVHDILETEHSPSKGLGGQFEPENYWMIYNRIENCNYGIRVPSTFKNSDDAYEGKIYIIGNVISHSGFLTETLGNTAFDNAAIHIHGGKDRYIYNNIINDARNGINYSGAIGQTRIYNNIIRNVDLPVGRHIWVESNLPNMFMDNNVLHQEVGALQLKWGSNPDAGLAEFKAVSNQCSDCVEVDPEFGADTGSAALEPRNSPSIVDKGADISSLGTIFFDTFGVELNQDFKGAARIQGRDGIDIGAYEFTPIYPTAPTSVTATPQ